MSQKNHLKLWFLSLLFASILSTKTPPVSIQKLNIEEEGQGPLDLINNRWKKVIIKDVPGTVAQAFNFNSLDSEVSITLKDSSYSASCYTTAIVNGTAYTTMQSSVTDGDCGLMTVSKINRFGNLIFMRPYQEYVYITSEGKFSEVMTIKGNLSEALPS